MIQKGGLFVTNRDYLYNKGIAKGYFEKDYFVEGKLGFKKISQGIIIPHEKTSDNQNEYWGVCGVIDNQGHFHKEIAGMPNIELLPSVNDKITKSSETVIYLGLFAPAWGHDLTINLKRLWFLNSEVFKSEFKNCRLVYTPWHKKGWGEDYLTLNQKPNFPQLLDTLGIDPNALQPIEQPTQFENVIVPDDSFYFVEDKSMRFTAEYRETINFIRDFALQNRTPTFSKKIYCFYGRHQTGEERMAAYFKSKGYSIILPERLTFKEQINLLINCESFASTLGSCSHNSLFLRDNTEAIFIPRGPFLFTTYQELLNRVNYLNSYFIDSSLSLFGELHEAYCFIISRELKSFFKDKFWGYNKGDFKIFLAYIMDAVSHGFKLNEKAMPYYAPIYKEFLPKLKKQPDFLEDYETVLKLGGKSS